mmetsp:Transcript_6890/g.13748  ORF Transcript_6890/g.13748 Transcript_6890/m.13748 type:complete len:203 (+) Transcript_6890:1413-2021(+)
MSFTMLCSAPPLSRLSTEVFRSYFARSVLSCMVLLSSANASASREVVSLALKRLRVCHTLTSRIEFSCACSRSTTMTGRIQLTVSPALSSLRRAPSASAHNESAEIDAASAAAAKENRIDCSLALTTGVLILSTSVFLSQSASGSQPEYLCHASSSFAFFLIIFQFLSMSLFSTSFSFSLSLCLFFRDKFFAHIEQNRTEQS